MIVTETEQGVALAILRGNIDFKREPWPQISDTAKSLVKQMLDPDPRKRLTAQQVLGESPLRFSHFVHLIHWLFLLKRRHTILLFGANGKQLVLAKLDKLI